MNEWKPDPILKILVAWIVFLLVFSWLPLVRTVMDGDTYRWGTSHFGFDFVSSGVGPDIWLLVVKSMLLGALLYLALRRRDRLFAVLLIVWSLVMTGDALHAVVTDPGGFEFHGDTLGIHLNLGWTVIAVVAGFAVLAFYWVASRSEPLPEAPPLWGSRNRQLLLLVLLLLPIQFLLLRFGAPHGATDAAGVLITIAQCPLLAAALYPWD